MLTKDFGKRLKYWRLRRGLTQEEFGAKVGTDNTQVSRYEHGRVLPLLPTIEKILSALDVDVTTFFGELSADKPLPETFGEWRKYWRERRGLSREELAKLK